MSYGTVVIEDQSKSDELLYLAMEFVDGVTLELIFHDILGTHGALWRVSPELIRALRDSNPEQSEGHDIGGGLEEGEQVYVFWEGTRLMKP